MIVNRLRSAEGHLHAIIGMLGAGAPCEEVLQQLAAVEAALNVAGRALRYCQFLQSINLILHDPNSEARIAEVERLATLYGLRAQPFELPEKRISK